MTSQELRELDTWIAVNVFGMELELEIGFRYKDGSENWGNSPEYTRQKFENYKAQGIADCLLERPHLEGFSPTSQSQDAMDVLRKCATEKGLAVTINPIPRKGWAVFHGAYRAEAETLETAICLFAKKLFEKDSK